MGWQARTNCQHLDNWDRCRVHTVPWWIRWLMPKGRPPCVFHSMAARRELQDGRVECRDQLGLPRPAPPAPMPRKG
jgi:hypothetical protein